MGFFFKKKQTKAAASSQSSQRTPPLSSFSGLPVRVFLPNKPNDAYLFTAVFRPATDGAAHLVMLSQPPEAQLRAISMQPIHAYLRGYSKPQRRAFRMTGILDRLADGSWLFRQITFDDKGNERQTFRIKTDFPGIVMYMNRSKRNEQCRIADISAGGVCLIMAGPTKPGEILRLSSPVFEHVGISSLICEVCYNAYDSQNRLLLCGCHFVGLREEEPKLAKLLMRLQVKGDGIL